MTQRAVSVIGPLEQSRLDVVGEGEGDRERPSLSTPDSTLTARKSELGCTLALLTERIPTRPIYCFTEFNRTGPRTHLSPPLSPTSTLPISYATAVLARRHLH